MVVTKYQKRISGPLLDRRENCLNCTFKQDAIAMHINTADARLIRNIQGADTQLSKSEEKMHALPGLDRFSGCLQLADYPRGRRPAGGL